MVKCSFSGKEIPPGTGKMFVRNDGKILYFFSSKEEKNFFKLKRKARLLPWSELSDRAKARRAKKAASDRGKKSA